MTYEEIKHQLNGMTKLLLSKGMRSPTAQLQIIAESQCYTQISYYEDDEFRTKTNWEDDHGVALNLMWNHIREIPELEERQRNNYLKKIAAAVEYGKKVGIDDTLINPLMEQMKRLSANIIEHKPQPPKVYAARIKELNETDDIPF